MALKLTLDSLDGVDEGLKSLYTEHDGKFRLAVDGLEDTSGLKSALEKERKARRDAEARAKSALSAEEMEEIERLRDEAAKAKGADEIVKQVNARHQKDIEARNKREQSLVEKLQDKTLKEAALDVMSQHKANAKLLMPHFREAVRVEEVDGEFQVVPKSGASLDEWVGSMKTTFPEAFADSGKSGGGASGGGAGGKGTPEWQKLSPEERLNAARASGK
jgi:hypothetical protein